MPRYVAGSSPAGLCKVRFLAALNQFMLRTKTLPRSARVTLAFLGMGLVIPLCGSGCSGPIKKLGSVGLRDYYSIHDHSFCGPNSSKVVSINRYDPKDERDEATAYGPGIGDAILAIGSGAAQGVAAAPLYKPARSKVSQDGSAHSEQFQQQGP